MVIKFLSKISLIVAMAAIVVSCGGGSTASGGSGIGGTGIAFVKGNVSNVDGQMISMDVVPMFDSPMVANLVNIIAGDALAQGGKPQNITVTGGTKTAQLDQNGQFELEDVLPNSNFVLLFTFSDGTRISLPIGAVNQGTTVNVINITLNTVTGTASSERMEVEKNDDEDSEDDVSADDDSEDDFSEEETSGTKEDDISEES